MEGPHNGTETRAGDQPPTWSAWVDVHLFAPGELRVRTAGRNVLVEANHEHEDEHGSVLRSFCRRYSLPSGYESRQVLAELGADGVLRLWCSAAPISLAARGERIVPVRRLGAAGAALPLLVHHDAPARASRPHHLRRPHPVVLAIKYL